MRVAKFVALIAIVFCARCAAAKTVWIDTDVAIGSPIRDVDDAYALVFALNSPEIQLAGISTSYGNASVTHSTRAARALVQRNRNNTPVFAGAAARKDLGKRTAATEALAAALKKTRLAYIALGPLTNLATFLELRPDLAPRIDRVIFLGGQEQGTPLGFGRNNSFRIHDANVFKDPVATATVLGSKIPITLVPISTASRLRLQADDLRLLVQRGNSARYLARRSKIWFWFWTRIVGEESAPIFDVVAIAAAARPELFSFDRRYAQVDSGNNLIVSSSRAPENRSVRVSMSFARRLKGVVMERLSSRNEEARFTNRPGSL